LQVANPGLNGVSPQRGKSWRKKTTKSFNVKKYRPEMKLARLFRAPPRAPAVDFILTSCIAQG
jgi:hypothetical protein